MTNPTRRDIALLPLALGVASAGQAEAQQMTVPVENASLAEVLEALGKGATTSSALTKAYLARIEAYDRGGPKLNSVRETNPDAESIAAKLDKAKPSRQQPLA
ncbi:MAG TPA: amidase, partial [Reyranella sp.]|nr:amidase [Reyranella sp.]